MASGRKLRIHFVLVLSLGVIACVILFFLPKTVVTESSVVAETSNNEVETETKHFELSESQQAELTQIKGQSLDEENTLLALSDFFIDQNIFDSAAYYAQLLAIRSNEEMAWLNAADLYYQAYSLSLNPLSREKLAEETRFAYQKVLEINPNQLHARTNTAMTYVSSSSPMQAILMLRQILEEDPQFVPAIMSMGALSMQSGQYDRAIARFEQVIKLAPANLNARLGLAYSLIELGENERAKMLLEQISEAGVDEVLQNEINKTLKSIN